MVTAQFQPKPLTLRFSVFEVNFAKRELFKHGTRLKIQNQPFEILCLLLERQGEVVSREEFRERLWPKNTFVEYEDSLNTAVRKLRAVLLDSSDQPRYIETIAGQGYRFIAPVEPASLPADAGTGATDNETELTKIATEHVRPEVAIARSATRAWAIPALGLAVLLTGLSVWFVWSRRPSASKAATGKLMLAVLPFQNLTGDPGQEYFSDGLTEEMISQLGRLDPHYLGVIARTSVMHYKNTQTPLDQIGRELGVQYVIEGSIRRDAHDVRVTAQLIPTKDQAPIWARQYDREPKGVLALQGEIAQEIADEIQLTLGDHNSAAASKPTASPKNYEAYDHYLKGQYFLNKRTAVDIRQAIAYFGEAIAKDANYARAYAGLADSYALMGGYTGRPPNEFMPQARTAALRALQLDDSLAEAHTALALIVQNYDWDWQTAEKEFRRAIELNPNYATAHHWYAEHLMWRGRFDEALQESERARQLDPLSLIIAADNGAILHFSRQYDRAIQKWHSVLEMDPGFSRAHVIRAAYAEKGMFVEALADTERMRPVTSGPAYWSWLAYIYGRSGQIARSRHALDELRRSIRNQPVDAISVAWAYLGVGDNDQALAWFEKAYVQHSTELTSLKVNPGYDPLRGDPRFQDLLKRVGLAN